MRVKIFNNFSAARTSKEFEAQVNEWLSENHVEIGHVVQSESKCDDTGLNLTLTIFYKPASRCL